MPTFCVTSTKFPGCCITDEPSESPCKWKVWLPATESTKARRPVVVLSFQLLAIHRIFDVIVGCRFVACPIRIFVTAELSTRLHGPQQGMCRTFPCKGAARGFQEIPNYPTSMFPKPIHSRIRWFFRAPHQSSRCKAARWRVGSEFASATRGVPQEFLPDLARPQSEPGNS